MESDIQQAISGTHGLGGMQLTPKMTVPGEIAQMADARIQQIHKELEVLLQVRIQGEEKSSILNEELRVLVSIVQAVHSINGDIASVKSLGFNPPPVAAYR